MLDDVVKLRNEAVCTPTIKDENVDPFDCTTHDVSAVSRQFPDPDRSDTANPSSVSAEKDTKAPYNINRPLVYPHQAPQTSINRAEPKNTSSGPREDKGTPMRNGISMSESSSRRSRYPQLDTRYGPPTDLHLDTQGQSRKLSEDVSPRQRKRVTFSLPSPASTVASTPVAGTPPSSPDTASSSSSEYISTPTQFKPPVNANTAPVTPRRPPLHRSSHSSSSYTPSWKSYEPVPPRSSSYRDLPIKNSDAPSRHSNKERVTWSPSTPKNQKPNPYSERYERDHLDGAAARGFLTTKAQNLASTQPGLQVPGKITYDCKINRCYRKGLSGFGTPDELDAHMKSAHGKDVIGRKER